MSDRGTLWLHGYQLRQETRDKVEVLMRGRAPGVVFVDVRHDDWCALLIDGEQCNCNPDLELRQ